VVFTHHVDHNADFFNFVLSSWAFGRDSLTVYRPDGTNRLFEALRSVYREDIEYRSRLAYPDGGIDDIELEPTTDRRVVDSET
jgi:ribonuclease BN (tRNA processing enzyme)